MQNPTRIGRPAILRGGKKAWQVVAMPGSGTWYAPRSGLYRIHSWGAGGSANSNVAGAGTGGSYQRKTMRFAKNDALSITIGRAPASATTITGPGGLNMNSGATSYGGTPPVPTGGDVNVPASGPGSVAAASSPDGIYQGGGYAYGDQVGGNSPGGGAQAYGGGGSDHKGAGGMVIIEEFF